MKPPLSGNRLQVFKYLQRIAPKGATISEIESATGIHPHQQIFQITKYLKEKGFIRGEQGIRGTREWVFSVYPPEPEASPLVPTINSSDAFEPVSEMETEANAAFSPAQFEILAARVFSERSGRELRPARLPGVPKLFDLVSPDLQIVGDAKYLTLVGGTNLPPAKFSMIAEYVWLLEKVKARHKFLVFGNQREVPIQWLQRYGSLVTDVEFYFLSNDGSLERLK